MNETHLAFLEPLTPSHSSRVARHRWQVHVEASCWLYLGLYAPDVDLLFCLEYVDALKKHSVVIDRARVGYLRDSLLNGRFLLEGFGELKNARLLLISDDQQSQVEIKNINFRVVRSDAMVKPSYRLVA